MKVKVLLLILPLVTHGLLYAMDKNETVEIINEATIAVAPLQDKFATLLNDTNSTDNTNESNQTTIIKDDKLGTSNIGLIIFKTQIKPYCKMGGEKFAKQYMQEDWEEIYDDKEFKMELIKACPNMKERYQEKWTDDLYQFALEYASDSDAIPEC